MRFQCVWSGNGIFLKKDGFRSGYGLKARCARKAFTAHFALSPPIFSKKYQ